MAGTDARSVFETPPDATEEARLDAQAEAEIDAGRGVSHASVREWLARLAQGEIIPPPSE